MAGLHLNVCLGDWHGAGLAVWSHPAWSRRISCISIPSRFSSEFAHLSVLPSEAAHGESHSSDTQSFGPESWPKLTRQQQKLPIPLQGEFKELR